MVVQRSVWERAAEGGGSREQGRAAKKAGKKTGKKDGKVRSGPLAAPLPPGWLPPHLGIWGGFFLTQNTPLGGMGGGWVRGRTPPPPRVPTLGMGFNAKR